MLLEYGENEEARIAFEAALALAPGQAPVLVGLAEALLREKQYERARSLCSDALKAMPDYKRAHYNLGLALRGLGRRDEAEAELNLGLNAEKDYLKDPLTDEITSYKRSYVVRLQEAAKYFDEGNVARGITILEKVIKKHSDDIAVVNNLASMYLQAGRLDDAEELFQLALKMEPNRFSTYINMAQARMAANDNAKAYEYANKSVELSSGTSSKAFFTRARVLLGMGQASECYRDLKKAVEYDATDWMPHAYLGDVAIQLKLYEAAVKHFDQAIKMKPDHLPAHTRRSWVLNELGHTKQARAGYERARFLAPQSPEVAKLARMLGLGNR
jgi:tetratricopeptide (TPR) repeat protein